MAKDTELGTDEDLLRIAAQIHDALRVLMQSLRRSHKMEVTASELTMPQAHVLSELAEADGLSVIELSQRMRLAHSTVSGIIDRLERQGMVERQADQVDRRFVRIYLSDMVRNYIQKDLPARRLQLMVEALRRVGSEERAIILQGLAILGRALQASESP